MSKLGASREVVEAELEVQKSQINTFFPNLTYRTKYEAWLAPGRFSWDKDNLYFDFYGQGKVRRITTPMGPIRAVGIIYTLAPSMKDRWRAYDTELPGDMHALQTTKLWERAAWNTVNEFAEMISLAMSRLAAPRAFARVITDNHYYFFLLPDPTDAQNENAYTLVMEGNRRRGDVHRPAGMPIFSLTEANIRAMFSKAQADYVLVARDYAVGNGGAREPNMPLMGG